MVMSTWMHMQSEIGLVPWSHETGVPASYSACLTTPNEMGVQRTQVVLGPAQEARETLIVYRDLYGFVLAPNAPRLFSHISEQARGDAARIGVAVQSATDLVETTILQVGAGVADPPLVPCCVPALSDPETYYRTWRQQASGSHRAIAFASFEILRCLQTDDPPLMLREKIVETLRLRERFASSTSDDPMTRRRYRHYTALCIQYVRGIAICVRSLQRV